jgi:hypothetical protein
MTQAKTRSSSKQEPPSSSSNASINKPIVIGVAAGAAGLVGGAVLGTRLAGKPKRVLGVRVPGSGRGLDDVAKRVGKAGKEFSKAGEQVGQLTSEVQAARNKADEIRRVIT